MPRVVLAGVVGGMLSLAGASYQGVFRNPLVDPYLLGVAAGAGLGATIVFAVGREATARLAGRPGAGGGVPDGDPHGAVDLLDRRGVRRRARPASRSSSPASPSSSFVTAVQTFVLQRNSEVVREVYSWILGTLSTAPLGRRPARAAVRRRLLGRAAAAPPAPRPAARR